MAKKYDAIIAEFDDLITELAADNSDFKPSVVIEKSLTNYRNEYGANAIAYCAFNMNYRQRFSPHTCKVSGWLHVDKDCQFSYMLLMQMDVVGYFWDDRDSAYARVIETVLRLTSADEEIYMVDPYENHLSVICTTSYKSPAHDKIAIHRDVNQFVNNADELFSNIHQIEDLLGETISQRERDMGSDW